MQTPHTILDTVAKLTVESGSVPSLAAVAAAAGLSKPGVLHHFPSRAALVEALVDRELDKFDAALADAASRSQAAQAWLTMSSPSATDRDLYLALAVVLTAVSHDTSPLAEKLQHAVARWEGILEAELVSSQQALLVRLLGDGLLLNALAGTPVAPERIAAMTEMVLGQ